MSRILLTGASGLLGLSFGLQYHDQHEIVGIVNEHPLKGAPFEVRQVDLAQPGAAGRTPSLAAQRLHRSELGCAPGRIQAETDAHAASCEQRR